MGQKSLLIVNPAAGSSRRGRKIPSAIRFLERTFPPLETVFTGGLGDATLHARRAVKDSDKMVICAGGDGTVNEVIQGLVGSRVPLAVLPTGTGNGLAREIGMPGELLRACEALCSTTTASVPVGVAAGRYFILLAGVGFDAYTTRHVDLQQKRRWGVMCYLMTGAKALWRYTYRPITFSTGEGKITGTSALIVKARLPLGPWSLAPEASLKDNAFTLYVLKGQGPWSYLRAGLSFLFKRPPRSDSVQVVRTTWVRAEAVETVFVHVDGELTGTLPMEFTILPDRLSLLIPQNGAGLSGREPQIPCF